MSGLLTYAILSTFFIIIEALTIVIEIKEIKKIVSDSNEILHQDRQANRCTFENTKHINENVNKIVKVVDSLDAKKNFIEGLYFDREKAINTLVEIPHEYLVDAESVKKQMDKEVKDEQ